MKQIPAPGRRGSQGVSCSKQAFPWRVAPGRATLSSSWWWTWPGRTFHNWLAGCLGNRASPAAGTAALHHQPPPPPPLPPPPPPPPARPKHYHRPAEPLGGRRAAHAAVVGAVWMGGSPRRMRPRRLGLRVLSVVSPGGENGRHGPAGRPELLLNPPTPPGPLCGDYLSIGVVLAHIQTVGSSRRVVASMLVQPLGL